MLSEIDKNKLKRYFENREDVAFAFLYGSQAHGYATKIFDVDIAVYFYPQERHPIEYESENDYEAEDEIWGDLERFLKKEVELLVLNRAAAIVAASAIRGRGKIMSKIRTFIAIEIPAEIKNKIAELQVSIKGIGGRISWTKPANIHLTLKFLGDTDEEIIDEITAKLQQAVQNITGFKISVKGTGTFPNLKRPRVIWVGAKSEGDHLQTLAAQVQGCMESFGFEKETRRFSAHLTLGRIKDTKGIEPVMEKLKNYEEFEVGSFVVKEFYLIKSELHPTGAIYTPLKKIVLKDQ